MATTDQIDLVGIEIPLRFKVGAAISIPVAITTRVSGSLEAVNVSGRQYSAAIGPVGGNALVEFTIGDADYINGTFSFVLSSVQTNTLSKGRYYMEAWEDNNFLWGGPVEVVEDKVIVT